MNRKILPEFTLLCDTVQCCKKFTCARYLTYHEVKNDRRILSVIIPGQIGSKCEYYLNYEKFEIIKSQLNENVRVKE